VEVVKVDPLATSAAGDQQRKTEVEMVEQLGQYRTSYRRQLETLKDFYEKQGNLLKAQWAQQELYHLDHGPTRPYLVVAEVAGPGLKAEASIKDADELYRSGMRDFAEARSSMIVDKARMYAAIEKFNQLITNYPTSDKIGNAAFQIGEINNYYLKDYNTALLYYQRCWQWDPQTSLPARFRAAVVYDLQLHDRGKAMELYQQVMNLETGDRANVEYSRNRIEALSRELPR
jgi:tetratricopeptide (TPR) repeat protein